jgi:FtsP/CotA-like multicopper oxidase with cupredoxin domain
VSATRIAINDNRQSGGQLKNGTFRISLEARTGQWLPEGEAGKSLDVAAWAEAGKPMQNPGPLIRVPEGTEVRAMLRNTLAKPLTVYGFGTTRGVTDSVTLEPGATRARITTPGKPWQDRSSRAWTRIRSSTARSSWIRPAGRGHPRSACS